MSLTLIVAAAKNNGIGQGGKLPWSIPPDLHYFRDVTLNASSDKQNAVVMGRYTWDEIPPENRPLHDRINIYISKETKTITKDSKGQQVPVSQIKSGGEERGDSDETVSILWVAKDYEDAISFATKSAYRTFIIGGAKVYAQAIKDERANRILITRILSPDYENCDVFFPDFQADPNWKQAPYEKLKEWVSPVDVPEGPQEYNGIEYEFQMWTRGDATSGL